MISPANLLLLLWMAVSTAMVGTWFVSRRRRTGTEAAHANDGSAEAVAMPPVEPVATVPTVPPTERAAVITSLIPPLPGDGIRTLTDILEGIELPYDLTPVTSVVENPDRHLIFLSTHSNAAEVGKRFVDQLERLGFTMESVDFDQAVAVRDDDVVSMKIVPDADKVEFGDGPRYGAAGSGDVALETWIGRSSVPPSTFE